jgi:hypothetical protein
MSEPMSEMSESERAAFYQEHKDDPDVWGEDEPIETETSSRQLGSTITVRLSADDADLLRQAAKDLDVSYSGVVRQALEAYLRPRFTVDAQSTTSNLMAALRDAVIAGRETPVTIKGIAQEGSVTGDAQRLAKTA